MGVLIHLDLAAICILVTILCTNIYRKMYKDMASIVFLTLIAITIVAAVSESAITILYAAGCRADIAFMIIKSVYVIAHSLSTPIYFAYIISIARTWHKMSEKPLLTIALCLPFLVDFCTVIYNLFTGIIFEFIDGKEIIHSSLIHFGCAGIYIAAAVCYVATHKKLFKKHQIVALVCMIPLSIAAAISKLLYPNSLVALFSNALGIMIMSMVIQRPEEIVDVITRLRKYSCYADDLKKVFINNNHIDIIFINIANYSSVYHVLGYDETNKLLRRIGDYVTLLNKRIKAHANIYYLDHGRYRITVDAINKSKTKKLAFEVNELFKNKLTSKNIDIALDAYICIARCPEDLEDFNSLMAFGSDFHNKIRNSGDVLIAEDLFKQREFSLINEMDDIIDRALEKGSLSVYYQPIYSVNEHRFTSAEALVRLIDDRYGFVPPDLFIPVAERNGTIHKIGAFVFEEVCRFIASEDYKKTGLDYIEINLSVAQCMQNDLADNVLSTINKYNISVSQINLEITETAASYNFSALTENMAKLNNAGVSFSLDDFGTGYSNMERVASLPLKIVKLDRSFVNSQDKPKMCAFLENFIRMFKDMNMEIVVEGIETEHMVKRFSDLKCDFIQGYYYSKPVPQNEFVEFICQSQTA
ncbi:MAG: EAL domain-containing protein [Oscillospiraceae bacterium]